MRLNPFRPAVESKRRGGPWLLPGILIALALAMALFVVAGAVLVALVVLIGGGS